MFIADGGFDFVFVALYRFFPEINRQRRPSRIDFGKLDAGGVEHSLGSFYHRRIGVFVADIDYLFNAALNDCLGTFVARKKCNVNPTAGKIGSCVI